MLLVMNAGSSSLKFQLFAVSADDGLEVRTRGKLDGIGTRPRLAAHDAQGAKLVDETWPVADVDEPAEALDKLGAWLEGHLGGRLPRAVGHRVVHGGPDLAAPQLVDEPLLGRLEALVPLAPLHQPANLAPIRMLRRRFPALPQVVCYDTAFHRGHPGLADRYAIPERFYDEGVRRYGFHGLSYEYIAGQLAAADPALAQGRVVAAHLGAGVSMCALQAGRSVDSTMGFSALDGLPMGTRPGQIDPGVILWLMTAKGMDAAAIEQLLYHECGLKGLSGISGDVRELLASREPAARLALDYFTGRAARELGALAAALGGLDGIVFTAGVGENAAPVRAAICRRAGWLGVRLDEAANDRHGPRISTADSPVQVHVVPTNEELMIARHTLGVLRATELR